jgi:uncharacterized protein YigA (DUF484 family)
VPLSVIFLNIFILVLIMSINNLQVDENIEDIIIDYLWRHPDFFNHHKDLLSIMTIPQDNDVATLRDKNQKLEQQIKEFIQIAQENDQLNQRIQRLIVALTDVSGLDEFFQTLYDKLSKEFNTDKITVRWFELPGPSLANYPEFVEYDAEIFALFEKLLESNQPLCGQCPIETMDYLFPDTDIGSAVLIPLGNAQGLLAMGSYNSSRFHSNMGIDFLQYLGELVSHLLKMWLQLYYNHNQQII